MNKKAKYNYYETMRVLQKAYKEVSATIESDKDHGRRIKYNNYY